MRRTQLVGALLTAALLLVSCTSDQNANEAQWVYFRVTGATPDDTFVIALSDPAKIAEARAIVSGTETLKTHVGGKIVPAQATYNAPWHFHIDPNSIEFFEMAIEVCDAATTYVEKHLDEVGGAFLPGGHWCPWSSKVVAEIDEP